MKWLTLIFGTMVLLPVWAQTIEDLKRIEDWELALTKAVRLTNEHNFDEAQPLYAVLERAAVQFQFPLLLQAKCLNNFAASLHQHHRYDEAVAKYRAAAQAWKLGVGPDSEQLATTLSNLGDLYRRMGKLESARESLEESIRIRQTFGEQQKLRLATSWNNLGSVQREEGLVRPERLAEARTSFERAIALKREALGPNHPDVMHAVNNLAAVMQDLGELQAAEKLYEQVIANADARAAQLAHSWNNLGTLYRRTGRLAEARKLFQKARVAWEAEGGESERWVATALNNEAELLQTSGDYAEAEPLFRRALRITEAFYGPAHAQTAQAWANMGAFFVAQDKQSGAESYIRRSWELRRAALGEAHPITVETMHLLSGTLIQLRRFTEAERLLVEQLSLMELAKSDNAGGKAQRLGELAQLQFLQQRYDAGQRYVMELAAVAEKLPAESRREVVKVVAGFMRMLREMKRPREAARLEGMVTGLLAR